MINSLSQYLKTFKLESITLIGPLFKAEDKDLVLPGPVIYIDTDPVDLIGKGFLVGDGDTSKEKMDLLLDRKKNYSDLSFVLSHIETQFKVIRALGFLGGRKDHEFINFGEFFNFLSNRKETCLQLSPKVMIYSPGNWNIELKGVFSLLFLERCKVKITGDCEYHFDGVSEFSLSSQFLSNKAFGEVKIISEKSFGVFAS